MARDATRGALARLFVVHPSSPISLSQTERALEKQAARTALARKAEALATDHLVGLGLRVLARNIHVGRYEIDVLCRDGEVIVVVEVRTRGRGSWAGPLASVNGKKQRFLRRAGERLWRTKFHRWPGVERMRFDIVAVHLSEDAHRIEHVRAAF